MRTIFLLAVCFFLRTATAKPMQFPGDSVKHSKTKKIVFGVGTAAAATGSLIYLNQAWYKQYSTGSFHFFADGDEWLQMDKTGHFWSTYQSGRLMLESMRWAGFNKFHRELWGCYSGLMYMSVIEVMDGFSSGYGFSWTDMGANAAGSLLVHFQEHFWEEQRMLIKFSFHQTSFPQYRPTLLGEGLSQQVLKDYNGQSYWLSINPSSFLGKDNRFPKWLNLAIGYGASGMISGDDNYVIATADGKVVGNARYRRCFLSLDLDLTRIKTRSRFLKAVFSALNCVKIPFPALELSKGKLSGHALFF